MMLKRFIFCLFICFIVTIAPAANLYDQDIDCPIPKDIRILNHTGSQCVWSSIETVGRWIGEKKLYNITRLPQCQGTAGPGSVQSLLNRLGVKFQQSYGNKKAGHKLIDKAMKEGRACIWGAMGSHAMVLVHYDKDANRVHWIDNMQRAGTEVKIMSTERFERTWDGWIIIITSDTEKLKQQTQDRKVTMWYYVPKNKQLN